MGKDVKPRIERTSMVRDLIRGGLVAKSVMLSVLLVIITAMLVAAVIALEIGYQVTGAADRRLADGATFFRASLDSTREDLSAVGNWLTHDREFVAAVNERRWQDVEERLALALPLQAVDEILVADSQGDITARLGADQLTIRPGNIKQNPGFYQALVGKVTYGIGRSNDDSLEQVMYLPIPSTVGERPIAVVRLASFLNEQDLDRFRTRTGLDASLFFGTTRMVTTLHDRNGAPLTKPGPDPTIYNETIGAGRETYAWQSLPMGEFRSYYVPLTGPDGARVGILAVAMAVDSIAGGLREGLRPVLSIMILIVFVGALLTYWLAKRVRGPILVLAEAAIRLREGDLSTPIPPLKEVELMALAEQLELARVSVQANLEAIANEEARQRAIFATLREPIVTTSITGQITGFNAASTTLFGDITSFRGRRVEQLLPLIAARTINGANEATFQGRIRDVTGRERDVEISCTVLTEGHLPVSLIYVVHDVSPYAELNRLREQLLYNVSHELRAPLAVLENVLEILRNEYSELTADEFDHFLRTASRTACRLRTLMEDLLSAGSIQSGRFAVNAKPTEIQEIIDEALETVEAAIETRGQRVECQLLDSSPVLADKRYACQALANLLSNASKYSPDGQLIKVLTMRVNGHLRITVEDSGPGIPSEQQAGLFDRFYRVHKGNEEPGIGLGLAIVKGIVDAHEGAVGVDSKSGAGTRVWFTLPVAREIQDADTTCG